MIRVIKPVIGPAHLNRGVAATTAMRAAFDAQALLFIEGARSFEFDAKIYGHASVKKRLEVTQHGKCCYCENKFGAAAPGDVEHFRPKKGVRQDHGHPVENPGYYWLAYDWSNLYFSCINCNRSGKRSFFPLADSTKRARIHSESIQNEKPLLLDPGGLVDPRKHIKFFHEVPKGITKIGRQTIKLLRLDRLELNAERKNEADRIKEYKVFLAAYDANPQPKFAALADGARRYLENAVKPNAKFSAMAQDLIR